MTEAHRDDAFADGAVPEAYRLMSSLLDGIVGCIVPPFTLSKIEGDAVFVFAAGADVPMGEALLDTIRACYADFHAQLTDVGKIWTCTCTACLRATSLDLKFVVHAGRFVLQQIAGSRELNGPDVVMAHRLLKNSAAARVGHSAYALLSAAAVSQLDIPVESAIRLTETYEHYPPIDCLEEGGVAADIGQEKRPLRGFGLECRRHAFPPSLPDYSAESAHEKDLA